MANPFANWTPQMVAEFNARQMGVSRDSGLVGFSGVAEDFVGAAEIVKQANSATAKQQRIRHFIIDHEPVSAPRMTQSDRWAKRPCVERYFDYRNLVKEIVGELESVPDELHCQFHFTIPESWSKKRRAAAIGTPHRQRPDFDNLVKAVSDALFEEDGGVWKSSQEKHWAVKGRAELTLIWDL